MLLKKATVNENIALTLKEKSTLENPIYLFEFINRATLVSYTAIVPDLATEAQKERFNLFEIEEGVDDRLNGKLILGKAGQYDYIIYEQTSTTNLDPSLADNIVERSPMRLTISDETQTGWVEYDFSDTYVEYE